VFFCLSPPPPPHDDPIPNLPYTQYTGIVLYCILIHKGKEGEGGYPKSNGSTVLSSAFSDNKHHFKLRPYLHLHPHPRPILHLSAITSTTTYNYSYIYREAEKRHNTPLVAGISTLVLVRSVLKKVLQVYSHVGLECGRVGRKMVFLSPSTQISTFSDAPAFAVARCC
jgi:hypothetical protein